MGSWIRAAGCATVLVLLATVALATALPGNAAAPAATPAVWVEAAQGQLSRLDVRPLGPLAGYSRAQFGQPWADVDRNGCDTRNDILARDLTRVRLEPGSRCRVESGALADPYTGALLGFERGRSTSSLVQIDHLVALGDAWQTGAAGWTAARRLEFANDPLELLAVDGSANEAKGDSDASEWLPPNGAFRCRYVADQVAVKTRYELWVTADEKSAITRTLSSCGSGGSAAPPPPAGAARRRGAVTPGAFCATARARGVSAAGNHYVCRTSATEARLRWRRAA